MEEVFNKAKTTFKTDTVKLAHLISLMNKEAKGSKMREDFGVAAVLLVMTLFKEGRLNGMKKTERNLIVNQIMNDL